MDLEMLKKENIITQKKGLPFILASVFIWGVILLIQFWDKPLITRNFYLFSSSCLLVPLAFLFSKILKAGSFKKTSNPLGKLGLLCTMNQMLYLLIVMWAFRECPEAMLMLDAIVFAAHLFPFSWLYDSKAYLIFSVTETVGALIIYMLAGNKAAALFMILMQVGLCVALFAELKKGSK